MAKPANKVPKRTPATGQAARKRQKPSGNADGRISMWLRSIWRQRRLSLGIAWAICIVGWTAIALWPNQYMSSALVYADIDSVVERDSETAGTASPIGPDKNRVKRLRHMLLSDDNLGKVRDAVGLDDERFRLLGDDIVLHATAPPVFVTAYDHSDPSVARQVLQTLLSNFKEQLEALGPAGELKALDQQIDEQNRKIAVAQSEITEFERINREHLGQADRLSAGIALLKQEVLNLQELINSAIVERDRVAQKLAQNDQNSVDFAELGVDRASVDSQEELATLNAKLAELEERYASSHPYVVAITEAIEKLEASTTATPEPVDDATDPDAETGELKAQHEEHISRLSKLNDELATKHREIDRLKALTETTSSVDAELSELRGDEGGLEDELTSLIARRAELGEKQKGQVEQASFRLIKEPNLPTKPTGPSRLLCLALVLFGGLGIAAIVAVLRNHAKGVFENAWQLKQRFDVGVLGTISEVLTPAERKKLDYSRLAFGLGSLALVGVFSGLAIAELKNSLAPWGELVREQLLR
ncbi:MAG: hypothetical protein ACR2Q4_00745 [Geminicoccaceae bacterium]